MEGLDCLVEVARAQWALRPGKQILFRKEDFVGSCPHRASLFRVWGSRAQARTPPSLSVRRISTWWW